MQFRPERYLELYPSPDEVDEVAFSNGSPQKNLVKLVLFSAIATVLHRFSIARSPKDGKVKYLRSTVKAVTGD